jgi:hypothetical protein
MIVIEKTVGLIPQKLKRVKKVPGEVRYRVPKINWTQVRTI